MKSEGDGWFVPGKTVAESMQIAVCVEQERGFYQCGAVIEPVQFECGKGVVGISDDLCG